MNLTRAVTWQFVLALMTNGLIVEIELIVRKNSAVFIVALNRFTWLDLYKPLSSFRPCKLDRSETRRN